MLERLVTSFLSFTEFAPSININRPFCLFVHSFPSPNFFFISVVIHGGSNGWLVGWLDFTALQHNIGYIAAVSVVNVRMSAHAGLVGSYHLVFSNSG